MSEHATELTRLRGMTLIAEDAQIRPAAMSYVKPSEYRYYAERAMQHMVDETTTHATALATVQAERKIAEDQRDQVTRELEEAKAAYANLILQTICRLPDVLTEGDWQQYLDEHGHQWLNDDRAFGGWVSKRLSAALPTARSNALREVREKVEKMSGVHSGGFEKVDKLMVLALLGGDA